MGTETSLGGPGGAFSDTRWSTVLRAKDDAEALGRLLERTWKPIYFYLRRKGRDVEAAKDGTQAFFAHVLEHRFLDRVEQGRGRFRRFLLAALEHFLANEYRVERAQKRGGGKRTLSLDFLQAESEYAPSMGDGPEALYERSWALSVLSRAMDGLHGELGDRFEIVRAHLSADTERPTYRQTAERFGISESELTNLLHKSRLRLRALVLEQLRDLVDGDPREELDELLRALSPRP